MGWSWLVISVWLRCCQHFSYFISFDVRIFTCIFCDQNLEITCQNSRSWCLVYLGVSLRNWFQRQFMNYVKKESSWMRSARKNLISSIRKRYEKIINTFNSFLYIYHKLDKAIHSLNERFFIVVWTPKRTQAHAWPSESATRTGPTLRKGEHS